MREIQRRNTRHELRFSALTYLEQAALDPHQRSTALDSALKTIAHDVAAAGTALLRPYTDGVVPWQLKYVGALKGDAAMSG